MFKIIIVLAYNGELLIHKLQQTLFHGTLWRTFVTPFDSASIVDFLA